MKVLTSFGDRQAEPNAQNSSQQHKYIKFHGYDCINFRCRLKIKLNTHNNFVLYMYDKGGFSMNSVKNWEFDMYM